MHKLFIKPLVRFKRIIKGLLITLFLLVVFISCNINKKSNLDLKVFFKETKANAIYPSNKQIEMLDAFIPKETYKPSPSILDRIYWNKILSTESGKKYLEKALLEIKKEPEVPITDSIYRLANKEGNRGIYKPRYYRTMDRLERFILAECLEDKGRFLPQIHKYSYAILNMKSWLHPNHDDKENGVLEGKRVTIDLGARKFGSVLTLANVLLAGKLKQDLSKEILTQLQWRITDSYLKSCKDLDENNKWIKSTSNWNSVCTSGSLFVAIATSKNRQERIAAIGSALNSSKYYLSGFGDDGYCSEGLGYWGYGFNHYLYLAQVLYDYTEGSINLFESDNVQKLINIGNFPEKFEIQNGKCAPFADGVSSISKKGSNFAYAISAKKYGAIKPTELRLEEAVEQLIVWANPEDFTFQKDKVDKKIELPNYSYFDNFGMVISRGKQKAPFSIAIKAGHNAENHNHSDVGTYSIVFNKDMMAGDIGAPSYTAGAFSKDNPARSSWGHPVPRINNILQSNGYQFSGKIISTKFKENSDKVVIDIKPAYEVTSLKSLIRTMVNDKSKQGAITISDKFLATQPVNFGTAVMTLNKYKIINETTMVITSKNKKIKVEVFSNDGDLKIVDEVVPVKHLREGAPAYRIGVDFIKPMKEGEITVKYTPIN